MHVSYCKLLAPEHSRDKLLLSKQHMLWGDAAIYK